jgi:lipopolysaccharide/colanic/teichoic acid biosynthesis glycosyltransferase
MTKRVFDVAVALLVLGILAPLFIAIAIAVKLDSPGPVFFRQERVGRRGIRFQIYKFRSMWHGCEGMLLTVARDSRITRVGAFLRRFKLDELPQLINVIFGDMSLVGPRPEVPRYVALYPEALRKIIQSVRPGITDPASVEYYDESALLDASADPERTYTEEVLPTKLTLYRRYVEQRSFAGDLVVLFHTVAAVFVGKR